MLSSLYSLRARRDADGFTLIELLIVVIIIGLLAAIALPIFIDQTKVAVDASVKSDVRNTVTNVTSAQAQKAASAKAAISDANTSIALVVPTDVNVVATKGAPDLTNVPSLGVAYSIEGWNAGGKQYNGSATTGKGAYQFNSVSGQFTQQVGAHSVDTSGGATADPGAGGGSTGGSSQSAPTWTTGQTLTGATQNASYSTTLVASGTPAPTYALASGSTLPTGLTLTSAGVLAGTPSASGAYSFTVNAVNTTSGTTNTVPRTFSLTVTAATPSASFTVTSSNLTVTLDPSATTGASGSGAYYWEFGDGNAARPTTTTYTYTYANAGTYTITLTARNGVGGPTGSTTRTVTVPTPPVASYDFESGTSDWTMSQGSDAGSSVSSVSGHAKALRVTGTAAAFSHTMSSPALPTLAPGTYTYSVDLYKVAPSTTSASLFAKISGNGDSQTTVVTASNTWTTVKSTFTISSAVTGATMNVAISYSQGGQNFSTTYYIDNATLTKIS